jgi:hypothetical protein
MIVSVKPENRIAGAEGLASTSGRAYDGVVFPISCAFPWKATRRSVKAQRESEVLMQRTSLLFPLGGFFLALLVPLSFSGQASAQTQANRVIDCLAVYHYQNQTFTNACSACHQSDRPVAGMGDRPKQKFAAFSMHNVTKEPVVFKMKIGSDGEWKTYSLAPGETQPVKIEYPKPNFNQSPEVYVQYNPDKPQKEPGSEGKPQKIKVEPFATPNEKIGNQYFFDLDDDKNTVGVYTPRDRLNRTGVSGR